MKNLGCEQCAASGNSTHTSTALGDPTNASTGNKMQTESDYVGSGASPLQFVRYYNGLLYRGYSPPTSSSAGYWSRLGPSWRSTYERSIRFGESTVFPTAYLYRSDGAILFFKLSGGQFVPDEDIADRLVRLTDGSGNPSGWRYTAAANDDVETYDVSGKLTSITSRAGIVQSLAYDSQGRLQTVTDSFGRTLTFSYNANGQLATLTDPDGKVFTYAYTADGNVSSVTYPDSTTRTYLYNESANTSNANLPYAMTGIVDENNSRFATFKYLNDGRVASTEHAGGTFKYSFTYAGNANYNDYTIVTDPLLQERTYDFTTTLGMDRLVSVNQPCSQGCGGAAAAISYDLNGNMASRTDFNGNVTNYSYDLARNLETSRTEAYGTPRARTISTSWHSSYRRPTQIDETGKRTTFTYDANGNVLTKTVLDTATSESRAWTYTYNSFGRVLTINGPRTDVADVTTYTYYTCTTGYECGQLHTVTNAAGHTTTFNTYNAHGQPLTITDPNGVVTTLVYDLRQHLTSRTVGGEQTTFQYWPTGLLKKVTLPDASYLQYTYDAAHRLTGINDSEGNDITYALDAMGNRTAENVYDPSSALTQTRTRVFDTLNRLSQEIGAGGTVLVTTAFTYDNNGNQTGINAPLSRDTAQGGLRSVSLTPCLGAMMQPEVCYGEADIQPRVQIGSGAPGAGSRCSQESGGERVRDSSERLAQMDQGLRS
ncbi:MAG TPA: DUF6531 domain-containing protein [Steroidobacteraceae bacterium]|nr:DUF6531 domain-containing protein [Steroidobacteraceae bacterium]